MKIMLAAFCLGIVTYFTSLNYTFLGDDTAQISNNPYVHSLAYLGKLFTGGTFYMAGEPTLQGGYYRPLPLVIYTLINVSCGPNPICFHLFQLVLHCLNAVLIFWVLKYFVTDRLAFILSLLFVVHPINVESVVYIADLQDVMFVFFGFLSFVYLIKPQSKTNRIKFFAFIFLSLLSKETGLVWVGISLVYLYLFRKRLRNTYAITLVKTVGIYLLIRTFAVGFFHNQGTIFPIAKLPLLWRIANIPAIIMHYLKTALFPKDLLIMQQWVISSLSDPNLYLSFLGLALVIILWFILGKLIRAKSPSDFKAFIFFTLWLSLGLLFHAQIIPLDATVSDRWFYFPFIGLLGVLGISLKYLRLSLTLFRVIASLIIILLMFRSTNRLKDWQDEKTLFLHDLTDSNPSFILENYLGNDYLTHGDYVKAEIYLNRSIRKVPDWSVSWNNLGNLYHEQYKISSDSAHWQRAKDSYEQATLYSKYPDSIENLAKLAVTRGDLSGARDTLNQGLRIFPGSGRLLYLLSGVEYRAHNLILAIDLAKIAAAKLPIDQTEQWYEYLRNQSLMNQ